MKTCVALIVIIVENYKSVDALNDILHENRHAIIGRLGIPHREKKLSVMSIVLDTDDETIKKVTSDISKLDGVKVNSIISDSCAL